MKCSYCGNAYENDMPACPYCGMREQPQGEACPACGAFVERGAFVCGNCGSYLSGKHKNKQPANAYPAGGYVPQRAPSGGSNRGLIITVVILAAVLVCGLIGILTYVLFGGDNAQEIFVTSSPMPTAAPAATPEFTPTPVPPPVPERVIPPEYFSANDGYLFPSDRVYITENDLRGLTKDEVAYVRNEIYARRGYVFQTEPYKSYFAKKSWYYPNIYFDESDFGMIEWANKEFIVAYEERMGWR